MVSVVVLNAANGFYQNSVYGLVGSFPYEYINAVVLGNNICGLFITIMCALVTQCRFRTHYNWTQVIPFSYRRYSTESCCLFLHRSFVTDHLYRLLPLCQKKCKKIILRSRWVTVFQPYFVYQMAVAKRSAESYGTFTLADYIAVLKGHWLPLIDVFCVFFVTLMLFPTILLDIRLYPLGRKYDLKIPG